MEDGDDARRFHVSDFADLRLPRPERRLRLGFVGGGRGAFIGEIQAMGARLSNCWEVVAGALSSDPATARASARDWYIAPDRAYDDFRVMAEREAARPDGIEAVAIVTPNHLHHAAAAAFPRCRHRRHLRQAADHDAGRRRGSGRTYGAERPCLRCDLRLRGLSHGAAGACHGRCRRARPHPPGPRRIRPGVAHRTAARGSQAGRMAVSTLRAADQSAAPGTSAPTLTTSRPSSPASA